MERVPSEVLEKIFSFFDNGGLGIIMQVCLRWNDVAETVWRCDELEVHNANDIKKLGFQRMKRLRKVFLKLDWVGTEKFQLLSTLNRLSTLGLWCVDVGNVSTDALSDIIRKVKTLKVARSVLSNEQIVMIFETLQKKSERTKLYLAEQDLTIVPEESIASAFNNQAILNIADCALKVEQWLQIFALMKDQSKVRSLSLSLCDISHIDPLVLARAFNFVKELNPFESKFSKVQIAETMNLLAQGTKLEDLHMVRCADFSAVDSDLLAKAINNLNGASLNLELSNAQKEDIIRQAGSETNLKFLCMSRKGIDERLVVRARIKIRVCSLYKYAD